MEEHLWQLKKITCKLRRFCIPRTLHISRFSWSSWGWNVSFKFLSTLQTYNPALRCAKIFLIHRPNDNLKCKLSKEFFAISWLFIVSGIAFVPFSLLASSSLFHWKGFTLAMCPRLCIFSVERFMGKPDWILSGSLMSLFPASQSGQGKLVSPKPCSSFASFKSLIVDLISTSQSKKQSSLSFTSSLKGIHQKLWTLLLAPRPPPS